MTRFLGDTSAWNRSSGASDFWEGLLERNELYLCSPVRLELLYSARGNDEYERVAWELGGLPNLALDRRTGSLAERTQLELAGLGQHRGPTAVDLLVAAIAEVYGATVLHYDRHFDLIAQVTGQEAEWIAPPGSLD